MLCHQRCLSRPAWYIVLLHMYDTVFFTWLCISCRSCEIVAASLYIYNQGCMSWKLPPSTPRNIGPVFVEGVFRIPVREGARTQWMGAPSWGKGARIPKAGTRSVSWTQVRGVEGRDRMRRRQEVKEDDSSTASGCQHAQSKWCALLRRNKWTRQRCVYIL